MSDGQLTLTLTNFGEGEDLRDGNFGNDQSRLLALKNCRTTSARKIARRYPQRQVAGAFGANVQSLALKDGVLYGFALRGVVADVGVPTDVQLLRYDAPEGAVSHLVVDTDSSGDVVIALMAHTWADGSSGYRLHVWDGLPDVLSLVTDPGWPWTHYIAAAGETLPPITIAVVSGKVTVPTPWGDTAFGGISNPRKWNGQNIDELLQLGYQVHYYNNATVAGVHQFRVPIDVSGLFTFPRLGSQYAITSVRLQEALAAGTMDNRKAFREDQWGLSSSASAGSVMPPKIGAPAATGDFQPASTPNTAEVTTYVNHLLVKAWMLPGRWYRFTWTPANAVGGASKQYPVSGFYDADPQSNAVSDAYQFLVLDGVQKEFELDDQFVFTIAPELWSVKKNGTLLAYTADYTIVQTTGVRCKLKLVAAGASGDGLDVAQKAAAYTDANTTTSFVIRPGRLSICGVVYEYIGSIYVIGYVNQGLPSFTAVMDVGLDVSAVFNGSGGGIVPKFYGNVAGNALQEDTWNFVPLMIVAIGYPINISYTTTQNKAYTPTAIQLAAFEDAQEFAGRTVTDSDSGVLPTASHDQYGGIPRCLVGAKGRLLVIYRASMQLWRFTENANENELLDRSPLGVGAQLTPHGTSIDDLVILPLVNGYWGLTTYGQLSDGIDNKSIGKKIERFGFPQVKTSAWWPYTNEYVAWETVGGESRFRVLDYYPEEKIAAWARWYVADVTDVDRKTMVAIGDRLYFRSGTFLHYFDASATGDPSSPFRDEGELQGFAYQEAIEFRMNDFKQPNAKKEILGIDVVQEGDISTEFRTVGYDLTQTVPGPDIPGTTIGQNTYGLAMMVDQLGVIVYGSDESGHELQTIMLHYGINGR